MVVFDHHYPPIRPQDSVSQKKTREWIKEQGIDKFHAGEGIGHVIFPEKGYAFPGALIFGTDSHTVTNSALGCVATGMGHSDIASYLALGYNWLKVPEVIRFDLHGEFRPGVYAKDIALRIAQLYGEDAAPYLGVEFAGPLVARMPMSERLVLCNMVIDFGAKTGYIQPDETTARWMARACAGSQAGPPKPRIPMPTTVASSISTCPRSSRWSPSRMIFRPSAAPPTSTTCGSTRRSSAPAPAAASMTSASPPPS